MATQPSEGAVPFAVQHHLEQFRLLELPPELVALLEAPDAPRLTIKSQAPSATASREAAYAVLCTRTQTYQLRQVQTSNSLFVTRPTLAAHGNDMAVPTTRAVASCTATLELQPSAASPTPLLEHVLPLYDMVDGEVEAVANGKTRATIFPDLPFSEGECGQAWSSLMAFESATGAFRPSASALAHVWKAINGAALAEGVKLDQQFLTGDISHAVADEGHPPALVEAVLKCLNTSDQASDGPWSCLDRTKTVHFVGKTLLEAKCHAPSFLTADFMDAWRDALPESWRGDVALTVIDGLYELPSSTTVRPRGSTATKTSVEASSANAKARKWHEKFGRSRQK